MGRSRSSGGGGGARSSSSGRGSLFGSKPAASQPSRGYAAAAPAAAAPTRQAPHSYAPPPARTSQPQSHAQQRSGAQQAHAQQPQAQGGMMSGLMGGVMQGMAFGGGSAIAHRAIDGIMGPRTVVHDHQGNAQEIPSDVAPALGIAPAQSDAYNSNIAAADNNQCKDDISQFTQCMNTSSNDFNSCGFLYDVLSQCRRAAQENRQWQ